MNHCGTRMLETDRLVLRPFVVGDAEAMFRNWASDSEVTKYLTWPAHANMDVTRALLKEWTAAYANPSYYLSMGDRPEGKRRKPHRRHQRREPER